MKSVLQNWVMELPLREQGTLLTAVRGCDVEPKPANTKDSSARRITAYIRWCFLNPADPREVDVPGAFFQSSPPEIFKPSEFGHLPLHWNTHVMHALEVIGYRHPNPDVSAKARGLYRTMAHSLHLNHETFDQMYQRLSEDRIESGTVVS